MPGVVVGGFTRRAKLRFDPLSVKLYHGIGNLVADPLANPGAYAFPVLFATFLFITYVMLYALTDLQPAPQIAWSPGTEA